MVETHKKMVRARSRAPAPARLASRPRASPRSGTHGGGSRSPGVPCDLIAVRCAGPVLRLHAATVQGHGWQHHPVQLHEEQAGRGNSAGMRRNGDGHYAVHAFERRRRRRHVGGAPRWSCGRSELLARPALFQFDVHFFEGNIRYHDLEHLQGRAREQMRPRQRDQSRGQGQVSSAAQERQV